MGISRDFPTIQTVVGKTWLILSFMKRENYDITGMPKQLHGAHIFLKFCDSRTWHAPSGHGSNSSIDILEQFPLSDP